MKDRATEVALFRYALIREAADPALTTRQRGRLVREVASRVHPRPRRRRGARWAVPRSTSGSGRGGPAGSRRSSPSPGHCRRRCPTTMLHLAEALKREVPARTAAQVAQIAGRQLRLGAERAHDAAPLPPHRADPPGPTDGARAFGRFEASAPNELWVGDALHGPIIAGHKTYLFAFIDDHSRLLVGYRWGTAGGHGARSRPRCGAGLRQPRRARARCYVDNGSPFMSKQLLRACASLGVRLVHSRPGRPEGRGKIERFFRTVRDQFLVEVAHTDVGRRRPTSTGCSPPGSRPSITAAVHSETGEAPLERFAAGAAGAADPAPSCTRRSCGPRPAP